MRKYIWTLIAGVILMGGTSCVPVLPLFTPNNRSPDLSPDLAALTAIPFANEAFIDRNQPDAYGFLSEGMRQKVSFDQYINLLSRMHPNGFPRELTATEFEPVPGEQALFIWLVGENKGETFYYRLRMEGTTEGGYKVAEMLRAVKIPASQSRAPLPAGRSTADLR